MKDKLKPFDFSPESIAFFERTKRIPVDFYSKDGQILIYKKEEATAVEMARILRFIALSEIYYLEAEEDKLLDNEERHDSLNLNSSKLIFSEQIDVLKILSQAMVAHVREKSFIDDKFLEVSKTLDRIVTEFGSTSYMMNGVVNVLEFFKSSADNYLVDIMIKRAIVAMVIKTRSLNHERLDKANNNKQITDVMLSAFFCDLSYTKMNLPSHFPLTAKDFDYISLHPLLSYMMLAPNEEINEKIKYNILTHHHPFKEHVGNNSYLQKNVLITKLKETASRYKDNTPHKNVVHDIETQIEHITNSASSLNEDASILSIASAFSSLTNHVPWRKAYSAKEAIRILINQSLFNYPSKFFSEFINYTASNLCDNQPIFSKGDFVLIAVQDEIGKLQQFELSEIEELGYLNTAPGLRRHGVVGIKLERNPLINIVPMDFTNFKRDIRRAYYDLRQDSLRQIIYLYSEAEIKKIKEAFLHIH